LIRTPVAETLRTMKKLGIMAGVLVAAFLAGYGPERWKRAQSDAATEQTHVELEQQRAQVRLGAILGRALVLKDAVASQNYGIARTVSTSFFDAARDEATHSTDPAARAALDEVVKQRDALTAALTQGDARSLEIVRAIEMKLRAALGYEAAPKG
jgi:hypothetical protein